MAYSGKKSGRGGDSRGKSGSRGAGRGESSKPSWKRGGSGAGSSGGGRKKSSGDREESGSRGGRGGSEGFKSFGRGPKKSFEKPLFKRRRDDDDSFSGSRRPPSNEGQHGSREGFKKRSSTKAAGNRQADYSEKPTWKKGQRLHDKDSSSRFKKKVFGDKPGFKRRRDGDEERPAYTKKFSGGGEARASRPYLKKGHRGGRGDERRRGAAEWQTFENESASGYVKKSSSKKSHGRQEKETDGMIRLNKFIANTGLCSRREADELIETGVIKVNGKIVTQLGTKIGPTDTVHYGDQLLRRENLVYILLNKPKDYITTTDDPQERKTVLDLVSTINERVYPVGRLDRNTTGVLLLTNDGDLAERLMHPKYGVEKMYQVSLDMNLRKEDFDKILEGIELEDGFIKADDLSYVGDGKDHKEVGIVLHSGRNRIVRRMFEQLGYSVKHLDRVGYAGLTKKNVPKGKWRFLEPREVGFLKMKVGGEKKRSKF